ncbi:MAG: hypothetical protein QOI78_8941 [Actinomycetota bacterium]|jgi:Fe-S cluster assembly iron-binding protein IscA|nr:hypothetical protein [Actinomycetota bacterium]
MLTVERDAARHIVELVRAEGAAPEGGLRVQALAGANPERPEVTAEVSATASETDTVFVDEDTGARVFADQATADVVDGRALVLVRDGDRPPVFSVR